MRKPEALFDAGMSLVKLCDLPDNMLTYIVAEGKLWVAATQWGDHKLVGEHAREDLIAKLVERPEIPIHTPE
jgi:hypothetical protein